MGRGEVGNFLIFLEICWKGDGGIAYFLLVYILLAQHHYNPYNGFTGLDSFNLLGSATVSVGVGF